jgi:hypothetical protein
LNPQESRPTMVSQRATCLPKLTGGTGEARIVRLVAAVVTQLRMHRSDLKLMGPAMSVNASDLTNRMNDFLKFNLL